MFKFVRLCLTYAALHKFFVCFLQFYWKPHIVFEPWQGYMTIPHLRYLRRMWMFVSFWTSWTKIWTSLKTGSETCSDQFGPVYGPTGPRFGPVYRPVQRPARRSSEVFGRHLLAFLLWWNMSWQLEARFFDTHYIPTSISSIQSLTFVMCSHIIRNDWSKLVRTSPNLSWLVQTGPDWSRLVQTGPGWSRLVKIVQDWPWVS